MMDRLIAGWPIVIYARYGIDFRKEVGRHSSSKVLMVSGSPCARVS